MGGGGGCGDFCCIGDCGFCCVFDCCIGNSGGCCVGNCGDCSDCSGDRASISSRNEDSNQKHAAMIANELAEMKAKSAKEAKKSEEEIIKDINETMKDFSDWLNKINATKYGGRSLNINIDRVKKINNDLRDEVVGFIGKRLDNELVMTNPKVSTILEDRNDSMRKKNFDNFYQEELRKAIKELIKTIETAVRKQSESIEKEMQVRLNEVNNSLREETEAFEELQKVKQQEGSKLAEKQVEYMFYETICDVMFGVTYVNLDKGK